MRRDLSVLMILGTYSAYGSANRKGAIVGGGRQIWISDTTLRVYSLCVSTPRKALVPQLYRCLNWNR